MDNPVPSSKGGRKNRNNNNNSGVSGDTQLIPQADGTTLPVDLDGKPFPITGDKDEGNESLKIRIRLNLQARVRLDLDADVKGEVVIGLL